MSNEPPFVVSRPLPNAVIYDLSQPGQVQITLQSSSQWSSGLHWHEDHVEFLKVMKGSINVRLGQAHHTITATRDHQPEIRVDRYIWHEWKRAQEDGEVIVIERTDPDDGQKALFFWNLNGVILDAPNILQRSTLAFLPSITHRMFTNLLVTINLWVIFYHLDNVPVVLNLPSLYHGDSADFPVVLTRIDWIFSRGLLILANYVGKVLGLEAVNDRYTPAAAYEQWHNTEGQERGKLRLA
ncbi:hypothetical protein B0I35DRAFT_443250 [Stachybotrys elegans]|uniref:Uncharacterized protein n=1 Tax=Stachybotrys elegans TaxID=80388 RepID=A0A8K0WKM2_9HYPO|nr:hypothetical protein B0I35DRAFT_443250 [Stachybotrys elegans]